MLLVHTLSAQTKKQLYMFGSLVRMSLFRLPTKEGKIAARNRSRPTRSMSLALGSYKWVRRAESTVPLTPEEPLNSVKRLNLGR